MSSSSNMRLRRIFFRWNAINPFDQRCFLQMFTEWNIIIYVADYARESTKIEFLGLYTGYSQMRCHSNFEHCMCDVRIVFCSINPKSTLFFFYNSKLVYGKLFHYELSITYIINNLSNRNNIKFDSKQFIIL